MLNPLSRAKTQRLLSARRGGGIDSNIIIIVSLARLVCYQETNDVVSKCVIPLSSKALTASGIIQTQQLQQEPKKMLK